MKLRLNFKPSEQEVISGMQEEVLYWLWNNNSEGAWDACKELVEYVKITPTQENIQRTLSAIKEKYSSTLVNSPY